MNLKQKYFIDIHKGITPLFIIFLIYYFDSWSNIEAVIYLALHGSYGILWITKSYLFPDRQWEQVLPFGMDLGFGFFYHYYYLFLLQLQFLNLHYYEYF